MDTKILVDITCIHCNASFKINKMQSQSSCRLTCPACKHTLLLMFNTASMPQRYAFIPVAAMSAANQPQSRSAATPPPRSAIHRHVQQASRITGPATDPVAPSFASAAKAAASRPHDTDPYCEGFRHASPQQPRKKTKYVRIETPDGPYEGNRIPGEDPTLRNNPELRCESRRHRKPSCFYLVKKKVFGLKAERYDLMMGPNIIGRTDPQYISDIALCGDNTISRRSVLLNIANTAYGFECTVRIMSSSNPVLINGRQIYPGETRTIKRGDTLTLGHTTLMLNKE